jgi:oligopeptide/dipeptide ABC transporter ATP-binding protein
MSLTPPPVVTDVGVSPESGPPARSAAGDEPALVVRDLTIGIRRKRSTTPIVHGVNLDVGAGERLGIVGESGSGKSVTMLAVMGLLSPPLEILSGSIRLAGRELVGAPESELRAVRGTEVAMIYQDPMTSLDPMIRIGDQVAEGPLAHGQDRGDVAGRVQSGLSEVGFSDPSRVERQYPHQLSGGMRQRVMIASALIGGPRLLIADEPTTALDVTIQRQILRLVRRLQAEHGMAVAWITHDLGVVAQFAQRVSVMYAGRVVETASTRALFRAPQHPYTAALLNSLPTTSEPGERLVQIAGTPPDAAAPPPGCAFHPRCTQAIDRCATDTPVLEDRRTGGAAACWVPPERWS